MKINKFLSAIFCIALTGALCSFTMYGDKICPSCDGSGSIIKTVNCSNCNGKGQVRSNENWVTCGPCNGNGKIKIEQCCATCSGKGVVHDSNDGSRIDDRDGYQKKCE